MVQDDNSPVLNQQLQRQMTLSRRLDAEPISEAEDRIDVSQTQFLAETLDQRQQDSASLMQAQGQINGRLTKRSGAITSRQGGGLTSHHGAGLTSRGGGGLTSRYGGG